MAAKTTATTAKTSNPVPETLFQRIQGEFLEMPGLCLTQLQACRLWGLDRDTCSKVLSLLVDAKFLTRTRDGSFVQLDRTRRSTGVNASDLFVRL